MNADLQKLVELQDLDIQIQQIKKAMQDFPAKIADLEAGVKKSTDAVDSARGKLTEVQGQKKTLLDRIEQASELLKRSQDRLNSITTNREYDAVHAEIESSKNVLASATTNQAKVDEEISQYDKAMKEAQALADTTKAESEPSINELKAQMSTFDTQIAEIAQKREAIIATLNKQYARAYESIMKRRKQGGALSKVTRSSKTCSSCHKVLETQLLNEIRKSTKLLMCQNCGSIFCWDEPATESAA